MRLIAWLLRAFIFFTLFAFALNNQQTASVHWFFGVQWQAPMVIVVLVAFAAGCAVGVMALLPRLWRRSPRPAQTKPASAAAPVAAAPNSVLPSEFGTDHPPRIGL